MGSVDFPAVISAAATSSLGVLSLIVLVISLLAYGFFRNAGETARMIVFAPLLLAAVAFGVSVMRESGRAERTAAPGSAGAQAAGSPATRPSEASTGLAAAGHDDPAAQASAAPLAQAIAGDWRDDDDKSLTFRFATGGRRVSYVQLQDGEPVGSGDGTIEGRTLRYRYVNAQTNDHGSCEGRLAAAGDAIEGRCASGGKSWGFRIVRETA